MWLVLGGLGWVATAPAAFLVYKLVLGAARRTSSVASEGACGLTFLRVFSLGRRTDMLENGDAVLMDLRSFSEANHGCIHELRYLAQNVPFERCLLMVDDTIDEGFLERTLTEAWAQLSPGSHNHGRSLDETSVHRFESGITAVRRLVGRLCEAAGA